MALLPGEDKKLVQIVDAALADAARRSGEWLVCRKGCTQCCVGPFVISALDVSRLQEGMKQLVSADPERAARVRKRIGESVERLKEHYPGNTDTGLLFEDENSEAAFAEFADEEVCPVLDPETGTCDLYAWRPMTCRTFGPPVRSAGGLAVCELCYQGATDAEIAACEMSPDPGQLEEKILEKMDQGKTIVAFALGHL